MLNGLPPQTSGFAWVRRDDGFCRAVSDGAEQGFVARDQVERIRIQEQRHRLSEPKTQGVQRNTRKTHARAQDHTTELGDLAQAFERAHHDFGVLHVHTGGVFAQKAHIGSSSPSQQCGTRRQPCRTNHPVVAPNNRHTAVKTFVRIERSLGQ